MFVRKKKNKGGVISIQVIYKVYRELERQLKEKGVSLCPVKAIDIAKTICSTRAETPLNKELVE